MDLPRVLYLVLASAKNPERPRAVLETWGRRLGPEDRLVFLGDDALARDLGEARVWPCVRANDPRDTYLDLPLKVLEGLRRARAEAGWDFIFKADDDTFAVPRRIACMLDEHDPREAVYAGGYIHDVSTEQYPQSRDARAARGETPFHFRLFNGGAGYALSRPALERAWPHLEVEMRVPGAEDGLVGAAMHRAGVAPRWLGPHFEAGRDMGAVLVSGHATTHGMSPADLRFLDAIAADYAPPPFEVARAAVGRERLGLHGRLGYDGARVAVGGRPYRCAISAHAPSAVLLRAEPGLALDLKGALDDSAGEGTRALFSVHARGVFPLAVLGEASRGRPTPLARVAFPGDGRLELRIETPDRARCHSVWLWSGAAPRRQPAPAAAAGGFA